MDLSGVVYVALLVTGGWNPEVGTVAAPFAVALDEVGLLIL